MAQLEVFLFEPEGAFHFGTQGVGVEATIERCPSDTLYAALLVQARLAGRTFPVPQADGAIDPPFLLSSCLPYAGTALLFPLPRLRPSIRMELAVGQRKQVKKIQYVSLSILRGLLEVRSLADYLPDDRGAGARYYQGGSVLIAQEDDPGLRETQLWKIDRIDHATVDRQRETSQYYAVGQVRFAPQCGLYVLAQGADPPSMSLVAELLIRLGHAGLGGRRSSGLGQFTLRQADPI